MNSYNSVLIKMRWCQYRCIYIAESVFDGEVIGMNFFIGTTSAFYLLDLL